jgi:LysM repeat protein
MKKILMTVLTAVLVNIYSEAGKQPVKHIVRKGETLYSIAKKYGVVVAEISKANHFSIRHSLKAGQTLLIPTTVDRQPIMLKKVFVASTPDTPYREEDNRHRLAMNNNSTEMGTLNSTATFFEKPKKTDAVATSGSLRTSSANVVEYPSIFNQYAQQGFKIRKEKGAVNFLADNTSGNQYLAFCNLAETGSVIRVTNLMNHKTVYVKVIGKVPAADASKEIMVKLSNKAAKELNVADEKFLAEIAAFTAN